MGNIHTINIEIRIFEMIQERSVCEPKENDYCSSRQEYDSTKMGATYDSRAGSHMHDIAFWCVYVQTPRSSILWTCS